MKICALLVPREMKFEHSGGVKATSDEQLEAAIEAIQAMPAAKAGAPGDGAKVIEGVAAPALPASSPRTSSDESQTFTEITGVEPSTFGFAVAVHPRPDTAWFVPEIKDEKRILREGKLVVTRTCDGGKSSEVLSKGLPQSHAYDVVYRHALALDETGERLAFGSTTGGLWVSENQGDSWAYVTHTLPPVYAVRFT